MIFTVLGWMTIILVTFTVAPRTIAMCFICHYIQTTYELATFPVEGPGFPFLLMWMTSLTIGGMLDFGNLTQTWSNIKQKIRR